MIVYLFGAYLKKYDIKEKITALKSLIGFFAMVIITFASKIAIHFLTAKILGEAKRRSRSRERAEKRSQFLVR